MSSQQRQPPQRIAISGLTAAGKTTLAHNFVADFDLPYISGSAFLRNALGDQANRWTPSTDAMRKQLSVERQVDEAILGCFHTSSRGVFDTWSLPWLAQHDIHSIWIESDLESRVRKCMVSHIERLENISAPECRELVTAKDAKTRDIMKANWGFDIYSDRSPFNIVLDASELISEVSVAQARLGAQRLYEAALRAISELSEVPHTQKRSERLPKHVDPLISVLRHK